MTVLYPAIMAAHGPCRTLAQARDDLAETLRTAPLTRPAREHMAAMLRGLDELLGERVEHGRGEE